MIIYLRLLERIVYKNLSIDEIAEKVDISERELRKKLIGLRPLYHDEAEIIARVLGLNLPEEKIYFFCPIVSKMGRKDDKNKKLCKRRSKENEKITYSKAEKPHN